MNLFHNNYKILQNENLENMLKLDSSSWDMMNELGNYCRAKGASLFELEVIKKDIIGIAQEADLEHVSLEKKLGMPFQEFCDRILRDGASRNWGEQIMVVLQKFFLYCSVIYFADFFLAAFPAEFGLLTESFIFVLLFTVTDQIIAVLCFRKTFRSRISPSRLADSVSTGLFIIYFIISIIFSLNSATAHFLFTGNGWLILAVLALLTSVSWLGGNYYWNRQSGKYNWR